MLALTAWAAYEMYEVLAVGGLTILEALLLGAFVALFAWIALSFVSTLIGFVALLTGPDRGLGIDPAAPLPSLSSRTAMLLPTYNEDPHRVMARLQAVHDSVAATDQGTQFDYFILSDTTDPAVWIAEEATFLRLREVTGNDRIYYRHRTKNVARKAGNIAEWVTRFGGAYDHIIVLDADSLMEGDTVVQLAAAMERHPRVGLIQTLPVLLNGETLFARIQQFAGRIYGPLIARGFAWWYGAESNYWGHNAIIRVSAFASQAGLPLLSGRQPFGGHIMSHDFVEAALLRRAGWGVHIVPSLGGSYEECPPTLQDYALRDRRWCQGNLQHLKVLPARGLHLMSRLHLATGIGSYVAAPLWLLFLTVGILIALQAQFIRPEYFPAGATLFPQWPAQDPVRAAWVFGGAMAMLVLPKLLGYLAMLIRRRDRLGMGGTLRGFVSVIVETVVSALIAPIMMLMQSRAMAEIFLGRDAGWAGQRREGGATALAELARFYAVPTLLGAALALGAAAVSGSLVLWMSAVIAGLALAIPTAAVTSHPAFGRCLRAGGLLLTAEERFAPPVLICANNAAAADRVCDGNADPIALLAGRPALLDAHVDMLPESRPSRPEEIDADLAVALARIDVADTRAAAVAALTRKELFAVLASRDAVMKLMRKPEAQSP
jgi:membrane glycosyltransferase